VIATLHLLSLAWERAPLLVDSQKLLNRRLQISRQVDDIGAILRIFDETFVTEPNARKIQHAFRSVAWLEGESVRQLIDKVLDVGSDAGATDAEILRTIEFCIYAKVEMDGCAAATLAIAEKMNSWSASCKRLSETKTLDAFRAELKTSLSYEKPLTCLQRLRGGDSSGLLPVPPKQVEVNFQRPGFQSSPSGAPLSQTPAGRFVASSGAISKAHGVPEMQRHPLVGGHFNFAAVGNRMATIFSTSRVPHSTRSSRADGLWGVDCFICCDKGIDTEFTPKEYEKKFGNKPYEKDARSIAGNEVIVHHECRCYRVWGLARNHVKSHPDDAHILSPLTALEWKSVAASMGF